MTPETITFLSEGDTIDAWHFAGGTDRPVVVMAHGFGGTKDSGLTGFAEPLAEAGFHVLAFDYRGFGASGGAPRQTVSVAGQLADYRAAVDAARKLPGVDPARVVLWGVSLSGGHVFAVAAGRDDVAAVISLTPLVDGLAAGRLAARHHPLRQMARTTALGVRSRVGAPQLMPLVSAPGGGGALSLEGALESYTAIAGPTWVNEVDAAVGLELGSHRPGKLAGKVTAPVLVQVADFDRSAPLHAAMKAAFKSRAHVHHYPCDHFDVWPGSEWHAAAVQHQVRFLERLFPVT